MASSSSSDESSKAPENFQISTSASTNEDTCDGTGFGARVSSTAAAGANASAPGLCNILRCPLCCKQQRKFHCHNCVKNGNITHSATDRSESLTEKQQKYINLQANLKAHSKRYEQLILDHKSNESRQFEIKQKREQLNLLHQLISQTKQRLSTLAEQRDELRRANAEKRKHLPKYPNKVKMLEDYVLDRIEKIDKLRDEHINLVDNIKQSARNSIQQLVTHIFPITEVVLKDEQQPHKLIPDRTEEADTIAALADAKNTSYIRGKWVFHGSGISEMQYRIVAPTLPANGDYTAYLDWLTDNKDDVPKATANEITPSRIEAYRIVGALTYTAQLTQLISFYLNVRLPHKLAYGDFCRKLDKDQFLRKVSRVNSNIMYLAYTQQVKLRALNDQHTLENILAILDLERSDLGRYGHLDVNNAPLMKSVDSLLIGIETATESESEDENSLRLDWEAVPSLATQPEMSESNLIPAATQQSTIAMAANRITSMLRWIK